VSCPCCCWVVGDVERICASTVGRLLIPSFNNFPFSTRQANYKRHTPQLRGPSKQSKISPPPQETQKRLSVCTTLTPRSAETRRENDVELIQQTKATPQYSSTNLQTSAFVLDSRTRRIRSLKASKITNSTIAITRRTPTPFL
jgi:hypothetical protein